MWKPGTRSLAPLALVATALGGAAWAQDATSEWKAPATAATKKNPLAANDATVEAGRAIFMANCASCHGPAGHGDGPAAAALERKPADLGRPEMASQSDGELHWKITNGRKPMPEWRTLLTGEQRWQVVIFLRTIGPQAGGAQPGPAPPVGPGTPQAPQLPAKPMTPEQMEQLQKDVAALRQEVAALKGAATPEAGEDLPTIAELERKAHSALDLADTLRLGTTRFFLAGTAHADYTYTLPVRNTPVGSKSSSVFGAGLELDALWKVNDWIVFEGGGDFELNGQNSTDVSLALANVNFTVNDYLLVRAGLMPTAFSRFKETLDAPWINKMPDEPLLVDIVPDTTVGIEARGAVPIGSMRLIYSVYTFNDPILNTTDPLQSGTISFTNSQGFDNVPGFGGKLGLRTTPEFEFGVALLWSQVGSRGTAYKDTDDIQVDLYTRFQQIFSFGTVDLQAEWVYQHIRTATYVGPPDPTTGNPTFGPFRFKNERQSGYVQLAYRLTKSDNDYVKNIEFVARGDWMGQPKHAPDGANTDTMRYAVGVDYWFTPSIVLKTMYEFSEIYAFPGGQTKDTELHTVMVQLGMGF
jgi:mono/diheme cytochrome c family protein